MKGPETIYAWRYTGSHHEGQWNRSKLSRTEAEYIRADIADARVAAAYEAAARWHNENSEHDQHGLDYSALVGIPISNAAELASSVEMHTYSADHIRALTPADAKATLEAVRREARAEALQEVRRIAYDAKDLCEAGQPLIALNLANQILALTLRSSPND